MVYTYGQRVFPQAWNTNGQQVNGIAARMYGQHCVPLFTNPGTEEQEDVIHANVICGRGAQYRLQDLVIWKSRVWYKQLAHIAVPDTVVQVQVQMPDAQIGFQNDFENVDGAMTMHGLAGRILAQQGAASVIGANSQWQWQWQKSVGQQQFQVNEMSFIGFVALPSFGTVPLSWYVFICKSGEQDYILLDLQVPVKISGNDMEPSAWTELEMRKSAVDNTMTFYIDNVLVATVEESDAFPILAGTTQILFTKWHGVFHTSENIEEEQQQDILYLDYDVIKLNKNNIAPFYY